jgi:ubiquinone/menaquinone biosynthesis C-methylase UbiE
MAAANVVGAQGLVYALDIEPKMTALVASRAAEAGLDNIKAVLNQGILAQLPDAVADFGLCALVLHYFDRRAERLSVARELGRLVKSGGHVLVVQRTPSQANAPSQMVSVDETTGILVEAGFELDGAYGEATGRFYEVVATKPAA